MRFSIRKPIHTSGYLALLFVCACTTQRYEGTSGPYAVAQAGKECTIATAESRYFLLFGALPISKPVPPAFTPEPGRTYRITEKTTYVDAAITLLGGWALTLTRRTIEVESCIDDVMITSRAAIDKEWAEKFAKYEKELQAKSEQAAVQFAKRESRKPVLVMNSGDALKGDILEIDADAMLVAVEVTPREDAEKVDKVYLRKGGVLEGRIVNQGPQSITLETGGGSRIIKKADIIRSEMAVAKTTIVQRKILKKDIKRILLAEKPGR